jgi:YebC/PmpR family DNA-binding regulatory protein
MKEIISAVKQGGPDEKSNHKLRLCIQKAKQANMPNENIARNIKKASAADTQDYFSMTYEFIGEGGVGIVVDILSDNKNRVGSEMHIATKERGGKVASQGSVLRLFERKGMIRIPRAAVPEETLFNLISDAGADDLIVEEDVYLVYTSVPAFVSVLEALSSLKIEESELGWVPTSRMEVDGPIADRNLELIAYLEDLDDVEAVYHNMDLTN